MIRSNQRDGMRRQRWQSGSLPRTALAGIVLALAAAGRAADETRSTTAAPTASPAAPAPEVSIEDAKRQFEQLKTARDASAQPKATLPRLSGPEFHSAPPDALPSSLKKAKADPEAKPTNWLIEAMEKGRGERKTWDRTDRAERDRDDDRRNPANGRETRKAEDPPERERTGESKREMAGVNPFAPYLAQWMSPQDYALLGASIQKTADGAESVGRASSSAASPVPGLMGGVAVTDIVRPPPSAKSGVNSPPVENPYLQLLNGPPAGPAPTAPSPITVLSAPRSPAPTYTPAPAPPPPKPSVPDFLKPQTDEKYFKPLKRF